MAADMWRNRAGPEGGTTGQTFLERAVKATAQAEEWKRQAELTRIKNAPIVAHHSQLSRKYRRAAFRPWLPIMPDPPAPETLIDLDRH
jgi:hypothetical protein